MTHPLVQFLSRPKVRIGLGATAAAAVVGIIALGAFTAGGEAGPRLTGPGLAVAVVPPVERDVDPGGTMDVGTLSDGFDRAALERQAALTDDADLPPDAYAGDDWGLEGVERMPMPTAIMEEDAPMRAYRAVVDHHPERDALNDGSRSFGFDQPRRDFAAEREARWAQREAAAAAPVETGPIAYTEAAKYSSE